MPTLTSTPKRVVAGVAVAALLGLPLSACGSDLLPGGSSSPQPVATIDALKGKSTAIALDKGSPRRSRR